MLWLCYTFTYILGYCFSCRPENSVFCLPLSHHTTIEKENVGNVSPWKMEMRKNGQKSIKRD